MSGQEVTIVGMVMSVRKGMTRKENPFVSAVLEDLSGEIEVTAWSEVYSRTEDLWEEGNTLLLLGKVNLRKDRVQLTCKDAILYEAGIDVPWDTSRPLPPVPREYRITLSIAQSDDEQADVFRLRQVFSTLQEFPGNDRVYLVIINGTGTVTMDLPKYPVSYSSEFHKRMAELVGDDGVTVRQIVNGN